MNPPPPPQAAIAISAAFHGVSEKDVASKIRSSQICAARKAVCYALTTVYGYSMSAVARELGLNHTSVMHALQTINPEYGKPVADRLTDYKRNRMADPLGTRAGRGLSAAAPGPQEPSQVVRGVPHRLLRAVLEVDPAYVARDSGCVGDSLSYNGAGSDQACNGPYHTGVGQGGDSQRGVDPECQWIQPSKPGVGRGALLSVLRDHGVRV